MTSAERAAAIAKQLAEEVKGQQSKVVDALQKQKAAAEQLQEELDKATAEREQVQGRLATAEGKVRLRWAGCCGRGTTSPPLLSCVQPGSAVCKRLPFLCSAPLTASLPPLPAPRRPPPSSPSWPRRLRRWSGCHSGRRCWRRRCAARALPALLLCIDVPPAISHPSPTLPHLTHTCPPLLPAPVRPQLASAQREEADLEEEDLALALQLEEAQREAAEAREMVAEERRRVAELEAAKAAAATVRAAAACVCVWAALHCPFVYAYGLPMRCPCTAHLPLVCVCALCVCVACERRASFYFRSLFLQLALTRRCTLAVCRSPRSCRRSSATWRSRWRR